MRRLFQIGAETIQAFALETVAKKDYFSLVISGGSTPRPLHRLLIKEPFISRIPWRIIHLFWVDDRCVPIDDPASNYGTAKKDFLDDVPVLNHQIHPMPVNAQPESGADIYQKELEAFFESKGEIDPIFDLIVLGIGKDGHTASLFPSQPALEETAKWVVAVKGGNPNVHRLTLTLPVLNAARHIIFLVSGKEKAQIVKEILNKENPALPAQRIQPTKGDLTWLMDEDAASSLVGDIAV